LPLTPLPSNAIALNAVAVNAIAVIGGTVWVGRCPRPTA